MILKQIEIAGRVKQKVMLLIADLDKLELINDNFGHEKGDMALIAAANVLRHTFRKSDKYFVREAMSLQSPLLKRPIGYCECKPASFAQLALCPYPAIMHFYESFAQSQSKSGAGVFLC